MMAKRIGTSSVVRAMSPEAGAVRLNAPYSPAGRSAGETMRKSIEGYSRVWKGFRAFGPVGCVSTYPTCHAKNRAPELRKVSRPRYSKQGG